VLSVAISNTGGIIASGSKDRTVRIWAPNMSVSISHVLTVCCRVKVAFPISYTNLNCSSKSRSSVIKAHTGGVRRVAFSADSCSLLSASDDKTIKVCCKSIGFVSATLSFIECEQVWSVAGQKFRQTLSGHSNWVRAAAFNSTGDMVLSGGDDKTVRLWDLSQRSCVHKFYDHTGYCK
jgi:centriolar protein POC1